MNLIDAILLVEVFNSTPKLTEIPITDNDKIFDLIHRAKEHRKFETENGDHIDTFHRDGAYEIHHTKVGKNSPPVSGLMVHTKGVNVKFMSTMVHLAKDILSKGHIVRIVGNHSNGMFNHYHKIALNLAKKGGHILDGPYDYNIEHPDAHKFKTVVIKPSALESIITSQIRVQETLDLVIN